MRAQKKGIPIFRSQLRSFALALLCCVGCSWANSAERVAIVFGNDDYKFATKLSNAVNDARAIGQMLETQLGFKLIKPATADSSIWSNVGVEAFYSGLEAFQRESATARLGLIYFAGHGIEVDETNFLIPVDAELSSRVQLRTQAVKVDDILSDLESTKLPNKILILDCCRNDPLTRSWRTTRSGGVGLTELSDQKVPPSTLILFSAAPGQVALDGKGTNSPFTAALISELPKPGRNALSAFFQVSDTVVRNTAKRQEPWLKFDGAGRTFREFAFVGQTLKGVVSTAVPMAPALLHQ